MISHYIKEAKKLILQGEVEAAQGKISSAYRYFNINYDSIEDFLKLNEFEIELLKTTEEFKINKLLESYMFSAKSSYSKNKLNKALETTIKCIDIYKTFYDDKEKIKYLINQADLIVTDMKYSKSKFSKGRESLVNLYEELSI